MTTATLTFQRAGQWVDMTRAYQLFVNNVEVGEIRRKSTLKIEVPAGWLKIEARIDWCSATPLTVTAKVGDDLNIAVSNTYGALKAGNAITEHQDTYLTLTQIT
jgi:hypothetical protein